MSRRPTADDDAEFVPPKPSRMEQEVEEILARSDRPISFQERVQARRRAARRPTARFRQMPRRSKDLLALLAAWPLIGALLVAALAAFVRDFSPLLAQILAVASVALLLAPIVQRFRRPDPPSTPMWRGRPVDPSPDRSSSLRDLFRDRFRPPGAGR